MRSSSPDTHPRCSTALVHWPAKVARSSSAPTSANRSTFAYDLWPIEDEGRARLIPLFQHDLTGDAGVIQQKLQTVKPGNLKFVQLERTIAAGDHGLLPLADVENALLHDVDLLRRLCGPYSRVTCVPVGMTPTGVAMLTVTLTGDEVPRSNLARFSRRQQTNRSTRSQRTASCAGA